MATTFTKVVLSGSTNGKNVKVAATATPGTTIHTAHATALDEVWLEGYNQDASPRIVTVEFGGTTSPDDTITVTIPSKVGPWPLISGRILTNSLVVKVFADAANVVTVGGWVNRITTT